MTALWNTICSRIQAATGDSVFPRSQDAVGGGCINAAFRLPGAERDYFVKLNQPDRVAMFAAEARGLQEIAASKTIRVPEPVCCGTEAGNAFLVLEYLELGGGGKGSEALGERLAAMHRVTQSRFGWEMDNTIGSTDQINAYRDDWISFWRDLRLGYQLELAARNGFRGRLQTRGERLLNRCDAFLGGHQPEPSLLHGDLWSGNYAVLAEGEPVIFDPAVYYGDREADLAMTELFGGFGSGFYHAYAEAWPLDDGYAVRKVFYNLYHILNHLNLFGGGYLSQAQGMIDRLLSELNGS